MSGVPIARIPASRLLAAIHNALLGYYGPQSWWPSRSGSAWEIMLGAVLTQRTTWSNVELSLANIVATWGLEGLSNPEVVLEASDQKLAAVLRPTGFFASKPRTLKGLAGYVVSNGGAHVVAQSARDTNEMREELLALRGIGPETADAILLYALDRPAFVADAYAQRLAARWGLIETTARYGEIKALFTENLPHDPALFNEYHALIVTHSKALCRPRPLCEVCPLNQALRVGNDGATEWRCPRLHTPQESRNTQTRNAHVAKRNGQA